MVQLGSIERKWRTVSLKSWRQVDITRDNATIEQREHAISDVILSDGRWVRKRVISELLW